MVAGNTKPGASPGGKAREKYADSHSGERDGHNARVQVTAWKPLRLVRASVKVIRPPAETVNPRGHTLTDRRPGCAAAAAPYHLLLFASPVPGYGRIMARVVHLVSAVLAFALGAVLPGSAVAQAGRPSSPNAPTLRGSISGQVIDQASRTPVGGASVAFLGTKHQIATDSGGHFSQGGLGSGTYLLQVRAIGYSATSWVLRLGDGEVVEYLFEIAPLQSELDPVIVVAPPGYTDRRLGEFEERRRRSQGVFFTADQIAASHASTLLDMLRGIPGVRLACRSQACVVQMTRGAKATGCSADWVVDGIPASLSGSPHIPIIGIIGIEIYRSASEAPPEFLKPDSQCGVIVIWTKSGP